jgi:hypothetical protein
VNLTVDECLTVDCALLDDGGNCKSCHLPFDESTSHSFPGPCRNKVTVSGNK